MKDVPIKFRGKSEVTGKTIYGIGVKIYPDYSTMILDSLACEDVEENSVAQLVGYDADGNEVYEGDKLYYYHCFCLSGSTIRKDKMKPAGVCTVISADRLKGLYGESLNNSFDYTFLLKSTVDNEKKVMCKNDC